MTHGQTTWKGDEIAEEHIKQKPSAYDTKSPLSIHKSPNPSPNHTITFILNEIAQSKKLKNERVTWARSNLKGCLYSPPSVFPLRTHTLKFAGKLVGIHWQWQMSKQRIHIQFPWGGVRYKLSILFTNGFGPFDAVCFALSYFEDSLYDEDWSIWWSVRRLRSWWKI